MRGRLFRRIQARKHKARARRRFMLWHGHEPSPVVEGINATTPCRCSCCLCEKHPKPTVSARTIIHEWEGE